MVFSRGDSELPQGMDGDSAEFLAQSKSSISLVDRKLQTSPVNKEKEPRDTTFPTSQVAQISKEEVLVKSPEGRGPAQPLRRAIQSFPRGKY